jgi:flagellar motor switch protein FliM
MTEILSQDEVDLLLSAVSTGDIPIEEPGEAPVPQSELTTYDFRRPERVSKEQFKGLQSLFEAFAREVSIVLPPFLRTVVRVDLASIDQLTYDEFILSISRPTSLTIIDMNPLEGHAVLELSPSIVFPTVDRVLGGKGANLPQPRELTEIENRIIHRLVMMFLNCLKRSWGQLVEFDCSIVNQESDPLIVQIVPGSEMVILAGYEIHVGEAAGSMNFCVPLMLLNPILDQISAQTHFQRRLQPELAESVRKAVSRALRNCSVPVDAILGRVRLNLQDIARLEVGDIVPLPTSVHMPLPVEVGGIRRFTARPGKRGDQSAVQIVSLVQGD